MISLTVIIYYVSEHRDGTRDAFCITINYAVTGSEVCFHHCGQVVLILLVRRVSLIVKITIRTSYSYPNHHNPKCVGNH